MARSELIDALELSWRIAAVLDDATVRLLELTSDPVALRAIALEVRRGIPAYDPVGTPIQPRDRIVTCAGCGARVWARSGHHTKWCSRACKERVWWRTHRRKESVA